MLHSAKPRMHARAALALARTGPRRPPFVVNVAVADVGAESGSTSGPRSPNVACLRHAQPGGASGDLDAERERKNLNRRP